MKRETRRKNIHGIGGRVAYKNSHLIELAGVVQRDGHSDTPNGKLLNGLAIVVVDVQRIFGEGQTGQQAKQDDKVAPHTSPQVDEGKQRIIAQVGGIAMARSGYARRTG
jgi:hypothetical protein